MRDSHPLVAPFSPITPRKSRARAGSNVGSEREGRDTLLAKKDDDDDDDDDAKIHRKFSLASLPMDIGVSIVAKLPVKSKALLTMLGNKELARWVRMNLFVESTKCAASLSSCEAGRGAGAEKGQQQQQQQQLLFCPFREETSEKGTFTEATDEDVRLYVKAMAEKCEVSERMRASLVAGLLSSSECGRRGRDRVTEMAKQPMGLRRLKQLTKARERSYAIVGDVEEAVRDERNDEMEGVDEDEDEDEFSLIESDTLRRECENLRAVVEEWSPEDIGETLASVLEKELQTFRTTKEARLRTAEEEVRRMLEEEREKERDEKKEEDNDELDEDEDADARDEDPFETPPQFDPFHYNAPADYVEEMTAYQEDGVFENDTDGSEDEDMRNDEQRFDWKIALDSICDARIYTFVHFCLGTPDFSHLAERIDENPPQETTAKTKDAWKRIKIGVSKMIQVAFKADIESEEKRITTLRLQKMKEEGFDQRTFCRVDEDENINEVEDEDDGLTHTSVPMDVDDAREDEDEIFPKETNRVIVEKSSALLALLTQHCATFQSVNMLDIPGRAKENDTNSAAFLHLKHFGDRGSENPFFESDMFATKIGGACMMQHLGYTRGEDATTYFDQNISMTSLFMFGIEGDNELSPALTTHMHTFGIGSDASHSSPMNDTKNVFDAYRDEVVTQLIENWDDSFVLYFMARSVAEATNLATKKRKRMENIQPMSSSLPSTRRVSRRRTISSPGVEKEEGMSDNALRAFKTDTQQRFASWLNRSEEYKHAKATRIKKIDAPRKFEKLTSSISKLFQRCEMPQRDISRVTNHISSTVKSKDIWSMKNKLFSDTIDTCAKNIWNLGCGNESCCTPKTDEKITKKLCKLAKIGYAAMSVIVEREDEEMNNHEPSKEIVVPHTWTL